MILEQNLSFQDYLQHTKLLPTPALRQKTSSSQLTFNNSTSKKALEFWGIRRRNTGVFLFPHLSSPFLFFSLTPHFPLYTQFPSGLVTLGLSQYKDTPGNISLESSISYGCQQRMVSVSHISRTSPQISFLSELSLVR